MNVKLKIEIMKEFEVELKKTSYFTICVDAIDEDDANEKAIDMVCEDPRCYELGNDADDMYEVESVTEMKEVSHA